VFIYSTLRHYYYYFTDYYSGHWTVLKQCFTVMTIIFLQACEHVRLHSSLSTQSKCSFKTVHQKSLLKSRELFKKTLIFTQKYNLWYKQIHALNIIRVLLTKLFGAVIYSLTETETEIDDFDNGNENGSVSKNGN